jgi:large repetitive protein
MKYFASLLLLLLSFIVNAQYPYLDGGPDDTLDCSTNCTTLHADYFPAMATSSYSVSQIPYNPFPFNTGMNINLAADDQWSGVFGIPFTFCFLDGSYNQLVIGSNGIVSFNTSYANAYCPYRLTDGDTLPTDSLPAISIFGTMQDMHPGLGGAIYIDTFGTAPSRVFTISYFEVPYYDCEDTFYTGQIALYETTNLIDVFIESKLVCPTQNGGRALEGIQDDGNAGFPVPGRNNGVWTAANDAWRFSPNALPNIVRISWYQGTSLIGFGDSISVCPNNTTTYRVTASYTLCSGPPVVFADTVTIYASYLAIQPAVQNVTCFGGNDGFASVNASGATPPYTYSWSPNSSSASTASGLTAGSYTATVWDATNCFNIATVNITQPPLLTLSDSSVATTCSSCNDGIIILTAGGGTPSYLFSIAPPAGNQIGGFFYNLPAGNYNACVTDVNGCVTCDSVFVDMTSLVDNLTNSTQIYFFPNPFHQSTTLEINSILNDDDLTLILNDALGRRVFTEKVPSNRITINRQQLPDAGIYYYRLSGGKIKALGKLIVFD